ncbi:sensor histidine kinase [Bacteriovorax sp. Seq25_V]|uniref:sensor histidine kinase n=1 Tax=Bacteriovorax sp. Seq25_V TaxID=1201288 RepID=UPI000389E398|nr:GAF domain-containing sensor histidine kinase [Bacteriovorax sp. Seq25_V]EQC47506.1 GHKL domain protein [Bacteriovorax sp. Seq25_V]
MNFEKPEEAIYLIQKIFNIDQKFSGKEYVKALVQNISEGLGIEYLLVGMPKSDSPQVIKTDITWAGGKLVDNIEYNLSGTPCSNVITGRRVCIHSEKVAADFPDDVLLQEMGVEAYVGSPIILPDGELLGLFVLLDTKKFENSAFLEAAIEIFASRIGVEIARERADQRILDLNDEVKSQVSEKELIIKKTHQSLLEQEKLASLGKLVAGVAHEMRNPLNLVLNSSIIATDMVKELEKKLDHEDDIVSELRECLDIIHLHSNRMYNTLKIMLDHEVEPESIGTERDLIQIVDESIRYAYHASKIKEAGVVVDLQKKFSSESLKLELTADIQSVFLNIIENALFSIYTKYMNQKYSAKLSIDVLKSENGVRVIIEDNGMGIPEGILSSIFDPFFTTKKGANGTGLGLSLTKKIIDKNNGRISVESVEGEGAKFTIEL